MRAERAKNLFDNLCQLILFVSTCRVILIFYLSESTCQPICRVRKKSTCRTSLPVILESYKIIPNY